MTLKERVRSFLDDTYCPITKFCKRIGISQTYFRNWLSGMAISRTYEDRMAVYLDEVYVKK